MATADRFALLRPLAVRDFRLVWLGESVSALGTQFHFVALPWLVLQLTDSGVVLGSVLMVSAVPRAILMLVGGALSDRLSPRAMMLASNAARAALAGVLTALVAAASIEAWQLYALGFLFGTADAFFYPAVSAIVPRLLPREQTAAGNALVQGTAQLAGLIGPALAGVTIAAGGIAVAFGVDAASFVMAVVALLFVHASPRRSARPASPLLGAVGQGVRHVWRDPLLRPLLGIIATINFAFAGPFIVGTAAMADRRFGGGAVDLGLMFSALSGGALAGTAVAGSLAGRGRRGTVLLTVMLVMGAGMALLSVAPDVWAAMAIVAVVGGVAGFANVVIITWVQQRTAPELLGRVMSLVMLTSVGLTPFSYALAGVLVDVDLPRMLVGVAGFVLAATAIVAGSGALRRMD